MTAYSTHIPLEDIVRLEAINHALDNAYSILKQISPATLFAMTSNDKNLVDMITSGKEVSQDIIENLKN